MGKPRLLLTEVRDGVLRVTINRPEKRNALSRAVLDELRETFTTATDDTHLLIAVLRGAGDKSFAAGGDLRDLSSVRTRRQIAEMTAEARAALDAIRCFPLPVVAALNGDALGGGAELAVACDFRVFAVHARIGFIHGRLNIATAWGGGIDALQLLGTATGLRLLSRAELLDAATALAIGLADVVASQGEDLDDALQRFLEPLLRQAPQVLRAFKALALQTRLARPRKELVDLETKLFSDTWVHPDHWAAADKILEPEGKS
ncbi:MAG: enoyl-CoA hydratase/isomerase family protein [Acidiferrobacterales bacterium]